MKIFGIQINVGRIFRNVREFFCSTGNIAIPAPTREYTPVTTDTSRNEPIRVHVNIAGTVIAIKNEMKDLEREFKTMKQCVTGTYEHSVKDWLLSACTNFHRSIRSVSVNWAASFGCNGLHPKNKKMEELGHNSLLALENIATSFYGSNSEQQERMISSIEEHMNDLMHSIIGLAESMQRK